MKKLLAIILAVIMVLSLVACGGGKDDGGTADTGNDSGAATGGNDASAGGSEDEGGSSDAAGPSDTLNVALTNDAGTLAPHLQGGGGFPIISLIMEPLWDVTIDGEVIMVLCKEVEVVSETQQILHLQEGVKFHNGNPLTADDVLHSFAVHAAAGSTGAPRVQTVDIEATKKIDDYTIELNLLAPTIANWTVLSQCLIYDVESYDETAIATTCIGTGPFKLASYVPNAELNVVRNHEYWGECKGNAEYINCKFLGENAQRVNALETGLVDIAAIATTDFDYVDQHESLDVISEYMGNAVMMNFNFGPKSALYQNLDARKAIAHAVNPQVLLDTVYLGHGKVLKCALPDYMFDFEERFNNLSEQYSRGYDVEYAKQLAEKSGLAGQTIQILTDGGTDTVRIAEIIQGMLSQIGVTLEITNFDSATVWQMMYSLDSEWEIQCSPGMAPNRRCGDLLVNGVRYYPQMNEPDAFKDNFEYLELAPQCMSIQDEKELGDMLEKMIKWYQDELLGWPMFDIEVFTGISSKIDVSSVKFTVGTSAPRYGDIILK